jgi:anaerobic dimethyl sulfoxide reductase subunit B (iron-sulfur subunit)
MIACMDKNNLPKGVFWRRVTEFVGGEWVGHANGSYTQNVFGYYLSISCNHCENPICVRVCPTKAMRKDASGVVSVDHDRCVGCRYCEWSCPYSAPKYDPALGIMTKCNFCEDNLKQGKAPACVAACPNRALEYGEYQELADKHGLSQNIAPLPDVSLTGPNLVVTPCRQALPVGSNKGAIRNPEEV